MASEDFPGATSGERDTSDWAIWVRVTMAAAWITALAATGLTGEWEASLGAFQSATSSGRVHKVELRGVLSPGAEGNAQVSLAWRDRGVHRITSVRQISSATDDGGSADTGWVNNGRSMEPSIIHGDLAAQLKALYPNLEVTSRPDLFSDPPGSGTKLLGAVLDGWLVPAAMFLWLFNLIMLVSGPQPWRATRWAWFWILAATPFNAIGALAYILLSGPFPGIRAPRDPRRRLTGGWSLILAWLGGGLLYQLAARIFGA